MAYSAGFSPHPKVSYAGAAPTGTASEAEYLEIALARACEPAWVAARLDASLPDGLDLVEVVEAVTPGLAERLEASEWQVRLTGVDPEAARSAVRAFLAAESVQVERLTKSGRRTLDCRAAVVRLEVGAEIPAAQTSGEHPGAAGACAIIGLVVRHTTPAVRPDDVLAGLRQVADLVPPVPPSVTRLAQGPLDVSTGTVADPLAADRIAASAADEAHGPAGRDGTEPAPDGAGGGVRSHR